MKNALNTLKTGVVLTLVISFTSVSFAETCVVKTPEYKGLSASAYCDAEYNIAVQGEIVTLLSSQKGYVLKNSNIWNNNCFTEGLVLKPVGAMVKKNLFGRITSLKVADIFYDLIYKTGIGKADIKIVDNAYANQLPTCNQIIDTLNRAGIRNPKIK